jgi:hypothetical protein
MSSKFYDLADYGWWSRSDNAQPLLEGAVIALVGFRFEDVADRELDQRGGDIVFVKVSRLETELVFFIDACKSGMAGCDFMHRIDPEEMTKRFGSINERAQYILSSTSHQLKFYELRRPVRCSEVEECAAPDVPLLWRLPTACALPKTSGPPARK